MQTLSKFCADRANDAPRDAFRISDIAEFAASSALPERDANGVRRYPISIKARRAEALDHWYWGRIVHNNSGVRTKDSIALDWCHSDELIGAGKQTVSADGSLRIDGELISVEDGDQADRVMKKGAAGIPFESSIFWDPATAEMRYLKKGETDTVNGLPVEGPCLVIDKWDLRGQAICPYGVDGQTKTQFTASGLPDVISLPQLLTEGIDMTDENPETSGKDTAQTIDKSELKRYMDKFGAAEGAQYFADSLTWEQALEKHLDAANARAVAAEKAAQDAADKLKSIDLGAESPTTDSANPETAGKTKDGRPTNKDGKIRLQDAIRIK